MAKKFKRYATAIIAALLCVLMAFPVMASDKTATNDANIAKYVTKNTDGSVTVKLPVTKIMRMDTADATVDNDFSFTMVANAGGNQLTGTVTKNPVLNTNTVTIPKSNFNSIKNLTNGTKVVSSDDINPQSMFSVTFYNVGVYQYKITENAPASNSGVNANTEVYTVDFVITARTPNNVDGKVTCTGVNVFHAASSSATPSKVNAGNNNGWALVDFTNSFKTTSLTVNNTVTGSLADEHKRFTYTFKISGTDLNLSKTYPIKITDRGTAVSTATISNGQTFQLENAQTAVISGLPKGAKVQIVQAAAGPDYTPSLVYAGTDSNAVKTVNVTAGKALSSPEIYIATVTGETISFTNAFTTAVPTGVMTYLVPFILLVVVAAVVIVIARKKKKPEDKQTK